jgi:hypothetical protein
LIFSVVPGIIEVEIIENHPLLARRVPTAPRAFYFT